jgi:DDE superfamily endonuclease
VTAMLQVMGRRAASDFQTYHRVLNRAVWWPRSASRLLRRRLVAVFVPWGGVVCGLDDPSERRRGEPITANGLDRDPGRSSHAPVVTVRGLRRRGGLLLPRLSGANRVWALPGMTGLCPAERVYEPRGRRHQPVLERAWQMIRRVVRGLPNRAVVVAAERSSAALALLAHVKKGPRASWSTRLRRDAALDAPPPPRAPGKIGRPRLHGDRRPTLEAVLVDAETPWSQLTLAPWYGDGPREVAVATDPAVWPHAGQPPVARRWGLIRDPQAAVKPQAVLSTTVAQTPTPILPGCVRRWTREVTRAEARAHLGMATQRQWPERASARTTPAVLSRDAIIALTAHRLLQKGVTQVKRTAW